MAIMKPPLLKVLSANYEPSTIIEKRFGRYDLAFKTDDKGRPILLFMGQKDHLGKIKGERYARRLTFDSNGNIVKDHWDHKGKATAKL